MSSSPTVWGADDGGAEPPSSSYFFWKHRWVKQDECRDPFVDSAEAGHMVVIPDRPEVGGPLLRLGYPTTRPNSPLDLALMQTTVFLRAHLKCFTVRQCPVPKWEFHQLQRSNP